MIQVHVHTIVIRQTVVVDINTTPNQVFKDLDADATGTMVNVNGTIIQSGDVDLPFSDLATKYPRAGIGDGQEIDLTSIVKADGAAE